VGRNGACIYFWNDDNLMRNPAGKFL
jgi:hypothetical protein